MNNLDQKILKTIYISVKLNNQSKSNLNKTIAFLRILDDIKSDDPTKSLTNVGLLQNA